MLEAKPLGPRDALDIVGHAAVAQVKAAPGTVALVGAWCAIAWFNLNAREVQWPAGVLLASCAAATFVRPRKWAVYAVGLASAVPISTLYTYQIPGLKHEPLYQTAVALIPAVVGSLAGAAMSKLRDADGGVLPPA